MPPSGYQAAYGGPGPSPVGQQNTKSITGFVLSIASAVLGVTFVLSILSLPLAIAGVIVSHLGLSESKRRNGQGRGLALAGVIVGYVVIALSVLFLILIIASFIGALANGCSSSGAGQASCNYGSSSGTGV